MGIMEKVMSYYDYFYTLWWVIVYYDELGMSYYLWLCCHSFCEGKWFWYSYWKKISLTNIRGTQTFGLLFFSVSKICEKLIIFFKKLKFCAHWQKQRKPLPFFLRFYTGTENVVKYSIFLRELFSEFGKTLGDKYLF